MLGSKRNTRELNFGINGLTHLAIMPIKLMSLDIIEESFGTGKKHTDSTSGIINQSESLQIYIFYEKKKNPENNVPTSFSGNSQKFIYAVFH